MLKYLYDVKMSSYTFLNRMSLVIFQTAKLLLLIKELFGIPFPSYIPDVNEKSVGLKKKYLVTETKYYYIAVSNSEWENMSSSVVQSIGTQCYAQRRALSVDRKRWPLEDQT
jgi:hypothetical protein